MPPKRRSRVSAAPEESSTRSWTAAKPSASLEPFFQSILRARRSIPEGRCVVVALSGIDGSGKGHAAERIARALGSRRLRVALVHADDWLSLPRTRFGGPDPAERFYRRAIRFDELFHRLVLPLRTRRSVRLLSRHAAESAASYSWRLHQFRNVDVILLEGIYLLRRDLLAHYDLSAWIDCSFETALERALVRGQEGLPPEDTARAYRTIYFPAQRIHFRRDAPRLAAGHLIRNDRRLGQAL